MELINNLRELYLEDLTRMVIKQGNKHPRPRVRHPMKWTKLKSTIKSTHSPIKVLPETNVWVWSDLHFGHRNIIRFANRPFMNTNEMDNHLINNFNDYVGENDVSIWVGDVSFHSEPHTNRLLDQCNGYKILIIGNHDFTKKQVAALNFDEIHLIYEIYQNDTQLVFTHYPMYNIPEEYFNIHGHLHYSGQQISDPKYINICCEFHEYKPINLQQIIKWTKLRTQKKEMLK